MQASDDDWLLTQLDIIWKRYTDGDGRKYTEPSVLDGIDDLAWVLAAAKHFAIKGHCPRIRKYLNAEVARVRARKTAGQLATLSLN